MRLRAREARLRAGLSQAALADGTGRDRSHIARWERDEVEPSFTTLQEILRACGFELSTRLETYVPVTDEERLDQAMGHVARRTVGSRSPFGTVRTVWHVDVDVGDDVDVGPDVDISVSERAGRCRIPVARAVTAGS